MSLPGPSPVAESHTPRHRITQGIACRREELRDGGRVSDGDLASYGWTEADGEWQFTGWDTPRAVEARRRWHQPLAKDRLCEPRQEQ